MAAGLPTRKDQDLRHAQLYLRVVGERINAVMRKPGKADAA